MPFRNILSGFLFTLFFALFILLNCETPQNPGNPSNTTISILLRSSKWKEHNSSIEDSIGNVIKIGAVLYLPENIDSIRITFSDSDGIFFDTVVTSFNSTMHDTVWKEIQFQTPGNKSVIVTPFTPLNLTPVSATISVIGTAISNNTMPGINISGTPILLPAQSCTLHIQLSDADTGQTLAVTMKNNPEGATLQDDTLFIWTPPESYTGMDTITFTVTDNGIPPMSNSETVVITVNSTPHPPSISVNGSLYIQPLEICTLTLQLSDLDPDQVLHTSMEGQPVGSEIINDTLFTWTVPQNSEGEYPITFSVIDNGIPPLSSSTTVTITVTEDSIPVTVNNPPACNLDTMPKSIIDTATFVLVLSENCSDPDNDPLQYQLLPGSPATDTILSDTYSFHATPEAVGTHFITIVANDPDSDSDTLVIRLAVVSSVVEDTIPPEVRIVTPVNGSATIRGSSITIELVCSDASGIASVEAATSGGKHFSARQSDDNYSLACTGLSRVNDTVITVTIIDGAAASNTATENIVLIFPPSFTVTYSGNGYTGGTVPEDISNYFAGDTVTISKNSGALTRTGHTFNGWNTSSSGDGIAYAGDDTYIKTAGNDTLYAVWTTDTFRITFNTLGGSTVNPIDIPYGSTINDPDEPSKTGHSFAGWYKEETCINIWNFATETVTEPTTLFAKWNIESYPLTYDGNGYTDGIAPASVTRPFNSTVTVADFGSLAKTGHNPVSWNTQKTNQGNGTDYFPGDQFTMPAEAMTLYVRWEIASYTVSYDGNNSTSGSVPSSQTIPYNTQFTVAGQGNLQRNGYDFDGWNTRNDGYGTDYAPQSNHTIGAEDIKLFAKWREKVFITVTFDANGGSSSFTTEVEQGSTVEKPSSSSEPSFTACSFDGWYKEKECKNAWNFSYEKVNTAVTLYAKWIMKDVEGNKYDVVKIGDQVWMAENLITTTYNNGASIPMETNPDSWTGTQSLEAYCWCNNNYGALYGGGIIYNELPLAPTGWHIPTIDEWNTLISELGGASSAGGEMKEGGFRALLGGMRSEDCKDSGVKGYWWANTTGAVMSYRGCSISNTSAAVNNTDGYLISNGLSVRCVRN